MTKKKQTAKKKSVRRASKRAFTAFESLESRQMMSVVNVADYGAVASDNRDDRAAIQAAIDAAKPGDVLNFGAGQYDVNGYLLVKNGRSLQGQKGRTNLTFVTADNQFGMVIESGSSNVTVDGFNMRANCGVIVANGRQTNLHITNNDFVFGYGGRYYSRIAVRALGGSDGLKIEQNYFHDSLNSDRNIDISDVSNGSYSYNTFYRVNDGGHVDGTSTNFKFVGNYGRQIHRMGLELQDHNSNGGRGIVIGENVFFDWYQPYWDSFGLSIMPQRASDVQIRNNYLSCANKVDGWGQTDSSGNHRMGYAIEAGFTQGAVTGNIMIGDWVECVSAAIANTPLSNNRAYGTHAWGTFAGEPGLYGFGSIRDMGGNTIDRNVANAPAAPSSPNPDPNPDPAPTPGPAAPSKLKSDATSTSQIKLAWQDNSNNETGFVVYRKTRDGQDPFVAIATLDAGVKTYTDNGLHENWVYVYYVAAVNSGGQTASEQITQQTQSSQPTGPQEEPVNAPPINDPGPVEPANPAPTPGADQYLSHLRWSSYRNGWGRPELDRSNGEQRTGDGRTITLNGRRYQAGLGVHAPSVLTYDLNGEWKSFYSDIGIDDEVGSKGSVIFQVWCDGVKVFDSGVMSGKSKTQRVAIDVSGVRELKLVCASPNGDLTSDHADWAGAKLSHQPVVALAPAPAPSSGGKRRFLSDLNWDSAKNGLGQPERDRTNGSRRRGDGSKISIGGLSFRKGLGVASDSKVSFALNGHYTTFVSHIGLTGEGGSAPVHFQLWADGKKVYDSGSVKHGAARKIKVDVSGKKKMWLVVDGVDDTRPATRAAWANAFLIAA